MKEVNKVVVEVKYVECPFCGEYVSGWLGDPSGDETNCDMCGKDFKISIDPVLVLVR